MSPPRRSAEALEKLYSEHPNVARIVQALEQIEGIEIIPDGVGNSFLRVRLTGPDAPYDHFLAIYAPFNASYVCWQDQPDTLPDFCRVLWKPYVKNASNSNGSNLRKDVNVEDVIELTRRYAAHWRSKLGSKGNNAEDPSDN